MSIATQRGWQENNMPTCQWCMNRIMIRGKEVSAVLCFQVFEVTWEGGTYLMHFDCGKEEWWMASRTSDPTVRSVGEHRTYRVLSDFEDHGQLDDPQILRCREDIKNGPFVHQEMKKASL